MRPRCLCVLTAGRPGQAWSTELHAVVRDVLIDDGHLLRHYTDAIGQWWLRIMGRHKSGWQNVRHHMAVQLHQNLEVRV